MASGRNQPFPQPSLSAVSMPAFVLVLPYRLDDTSDQIAAVGAVDDDDFAHPVARDFADDRGDRRTLVQHRMTTATPRGSIAGHNPGTALAGCRQ
jgi:hypothetical protein